MQPHGADNVALGRPSSYTQEVADRICERLVEGQSLRTICRDEDMPSIPTVLRWQSNPVFRDQYARAREAQADTLADESLEIADDARNDWMDVYGKDGEVVGRQLDHEHVARSKLRLEARRWYAGKLKPKVYGDRQQLEHTGKDGDPLSLLLLQVSGATLKPGDE